MNLLSKIAKTSPRETSGSETSSRYDYQKDWAIVLLIDSYNHMADFLLFLDYHEDLMILNSSLKPTSIDCYQIKTKKAGTWTVRSLIARSKPPKKDELSIVGKLYCSKVRFGKYVSSLNFVTNVHFSLRNPIGKGNQVCSDFVKVTSLHSKEKKDIIKAIKVEHGKKVAKKVLDLFFLRVSNLSLNDHEAHVKGKLGDFLAKLYPGASLNIQLIYDSIFSEIRRRTNFCSKISVPSLNRKSISRAEFHSIVQTVGIKKNLADNWNAIETRFNQEDLDIISIKRIRMQWRNIEIHLLNPTNSIIQQALFEMNKLLTEISTGSPPAKHLMVLVNHLVERLYVTKPKIANPLERPLIEAIALAAIYVD
jgi:hypothetical protein